VENRATAISTLYFFSNRLIETTKNHKIICIMKKSLLVSIFSIFAAASAHTQTVSDVLRYSALNPSGTARFTGVGGAFTALGAEFGAISQNPAGLAMFRSSEVMFTPSMRFNAVSAALPNELATKETSSRFGFDNFGIVFNTTPRSQYRNDRNSRARGRDEPQGWTTFNVGIGMNRQASFSQAVFYEGNARGTIMNSFYKDAEGTLSSGGTLDDLYPFTSGLAWDANALYEDQDGFLSYDFIDNPDAPVRRSHAVNTYGRMNELNLSFAGNYAEKLMIGASFGVPFVNYRVEGEYIETDPANVDSVAFFDQLIYTEFLRTQGFGINAKLGFIYRPVQMLRIGASVHTPTRIDLTDSYSNTFAYDYTDGNGSTKGEVLESPEGTTSYRLVTPWRVNAGVAVLAKNVGFVSADVEVLDYGNNRYNLDADVPNAASARDERALNSEIQRAYRQTMNVRLGAEIVVRNLRLRAGAGMLGRPGATDTGFNMTYSAGVGIRQESFYLDLGYRYMQRNSSVLPYADAPVASTVVNNNDVVLTVGFKF
jgi:hypothetical protein